MLERLLAEEFTLTFPDRRLYTREHEIHSLRDSRPSPPGWCSTWKIHGCMCTAAPR